MIDFVLLLFLLGFTVLAVKRIDWASLFILATLPSYLIRFQNFIIPLTLLEAMILITFLVWLFSQTKLKDFLQGRYSIKTFLQERKQRLAYPFGIEIILVLIVSFIAVAVSGFSSSALGIWKAYFFEPVLLYILLLNNFSGKEGAKKIILSLSIAVLLVSVYAGFQQFTGFGIANSFWANPEARRVVSFFGYPNAVGLFLAPLLIVLFAYLHTANLRQNKIKSVCLGLSILLGLGAIYFAKSEGAVIALLGGLFVFGLFFARASRFVALGLLLVVIIFTSSQTWSRDYVLEKATLMDVSGQIRQQQWQETWNMLRDGNLFLGSGLAGYQQAIAPYHQEGIFVDDGDPMFRRKLVFGDEQYKIDHWQPTEIYLYPHNIFLNFWTELGLAGMLLFAWIFLKTIYVGFNNFFKHRSVLSLGLACAFLIMLIHGLVDVPYFKNDLAALFWILVALLALIRLENKQQNI